MTKAVNFKDGHNWIGGIDFSGARAAGERIWIAWCRIAEDTLNLVDLFQAKSLPGSGPARRLSHTVLAQFIGSQNDAVFGLDFPFSMPRTLVGETTSWKEFVLGFDGAYPSPEDFRNLARARIAGKEIKRATDIESRAPFSPFNLRVFRQTYFGIRDVLAPLIQTNTACILPMEQPVDGKAWVIEICPASTLKKEHFGSPYKGRTHNRRAARRRILKFLEEHFHLMVSADAMRSAIIDDVGGDALDSVLAALAVFKAYRNSFNIDVSFPYQIEGWIYV